MEAKVLPLSGHPLEGWLGSTEQLFVQRMNQHEPQNQPFMPTFRQTLGEVKATMYLLDPCPSWLIKTTRKGLVKWVVVNASL